MANNSDNLSMSGLTNALNDQDHAGLMNALRTLAGLPPDVLETLTPKVRTRVDHLRDIQSEHDELEKQFFEEKAALVDKYQKLYQPLYAKRYEIVNGLLEVEENEQATEEEGKEAEEEAKGVPDFWLLALKNNEVVGEQISEEDEGALKYLKDIKWSRVQEPKGFKLDFSFDENPFFKNTVLTKTYHMVDEDEPILEKAVGTEIEWHPGKCLTENLHKKKPKNDQNNGKPDAKADESESFFNFFSPPDVPKEDERLDDDAAAKLQNQMEQDYDVGSTIRDKVIPHAVYWYTGEAVEGNDLDDDDSDDDDDYIIGDDDSDDYEDEDEDEDDGGETEAKNGGADAGEGPPGARPPECKQQ